MAVKFISENHKYESIDTNESITWTSVTSFISQFKAKFDAEKAAEKASKNSKSKWYKVPPEKIKEIWETETKRAITLGSWYHDQREKDTLSVNTIQREGLNLPVISPLYDGIIKIAPDQRLTPGIYPEHLVYLKSAGICGQIDRLEVVNNFVNIDDYKTNKEIKKESYVNWEGISQKMLSPIDHLDDCNFYHYSLQLSLYMYIVIKHNPRLKPGKMTLKHIIFEEEAKDNFGYPILKFDQNGDPIVKEVVSYEIPYLKKEVIDMINYKNN
jgi:hypothetical protein